MGNISYTAHVSNKKSAITSKSKLAAVAKHNLRKYKSSDYSKDNICIIYGTSNLIDDVKTVYHKEFDEALEEYNKKQARPDRKIEDYFEHVAGKEQDMAVEIIIQIGDREFWRQFDDMKSYMKLSYQIMLDELRKRLLQFVVANAVVHLDEDSPHMHIMRIVRICTLLESLWQMDIRKVLASKCQNGRYSLNLCYHECCRMSFERWRIKK